MSFIYPKSGRNGIQYSVMSRESDSYSESIFEIVGLENIEYENHCVSENDCDIGYTDSHFEKISIIILRRSPQ